MRVMRIVILLLFLMKAALAAPSVYIVTGIGWGEHDGVYEEKREPELHYKQLGEADKYGNYYFLYTDSRFPKTWILGRGIDLATVYAHYRAPAKDGRPMVTQWRYVHDWSREGKEQGDPKPSLRVVGVETNSTGEEVEKQLLGGEDIVKEEYIICGTPRGEVDILTSCEICNKIKDCATGIDEPDDCPVYVSPSFELPVYCCLVVLVIGVLLHLGWKALKKEVEDGAMEMEMIVAAGRQLEEAVDKIVEAAVKDLPFPIQASYEIVHNHCGGVELLIGDRCGKTKYHGTV